MSATDELRRMLDEAGVEWDYGITGAASTRFNTNGVELTFIDMRDGVTCSTILTPAQVIAATLGDTDATPARQGDADLAADNARLRVFASCAYGIASEFMRLNGCPYYDNGMECSLSDECEEKDWAEQPDCLLDVLAKALGIEVGE